MPIPNKADLENMKQDIDDLEQIVNTVDDTDITTRLGKVHKSLTGRMNDLQTQLDAKDVEGQAALATAKDKLARYAAINYTGDFVASTAYEANDVWKNTADGSLWIVPADYTSGATAQADIDAKAVRPHQDRDRVEQVKSLEELKLVVPAYAGQFFYLSAGGRSGPFEYLVGDYGAEVAADPLKGVHVALDSDQDGSEGVLRRVLNGSVKVSWLGDSGDCGAFFVFIVETTDFEIDLDIDSSLSATVPSNFDFRRLRGVGSITLKTYNPLLSTDEARAISSTFRPSRVVSLSNIFDRMTDGLSVSVACYGDSTTAGVATTGYTPNSISESQAAGTSDETANSPNAFPNLMITTLRDMYDNTNINIYNCGYSGQSVANGWALRNYSSAILNNPDIGVPDCCLIQFGLNDVNLVGYSTDLFYEETEKLVLLMIGLGTLPILVTSDPSSTGAGGDRNNNRMLAIDNVKREIADKYSIPLLDNHRELKTFMSNNLEWISGDDSYRWARIQNDGTHVNDTGHAFKSGFFCASLYSGTVFVQNDSEYIATWDARTNTIADFDDSNSSPTKNTRVHKNAYIANCPASTNLMRMYVYNADLNTRLFYRGIGNEGYNGSGGQNPKIVTDHISTLSSSKELFIKGATQSVESSYSSSDIVYDAGRLDYGLNLVRYVSGTIGPYNAYFGSFEIVKNCENHTSKTLLSGFSTKSASNTVILTDRIVKKSLTVPAISTSALRLNVDVVVPKLNGVVLWSAQNFDGSNNSFQNNRLVSVVAIRNNDDSLSIVLMRHDASSGAIISQTTLGTSSVLTITNDEINKLIVVNSATTGQRWRMYNGPTLSGAILMDFTILFANPMPPWGGIVGGSYHEGSSVTEVHTRSINACIM